MTSHRTTRTPRVRLLAAALALATSAGLSGCSLLDRGGEPVEAQPTASPTEKLYDSQFTRDGTFQSHISVDGASGIDFVYTLYPTKSTPRTNEWYARGSKFFSFTFQAYDLDRAIRAPFATKRKVYLDRIKVASRTITAGGGKPQQPYRLDAEARDVTFDPQPLSTTYGMLITSPKGAFELRNQKIKGTSKDTRGIELMFTATVSIQESPGSSRFIQRTVKQTVPIAIFESDEKTDRAKIPVNAN
ncbi:hypothetical protein I601_0185 [Nocardioides dokdonensis FR1436]|uniref:Lipoprotein n=1 Tax=Nocardioides dokdonensis FR1436 TaxID=1300347 RepID=A0A1A9GE96_9ACTN|nr:hypothetical protein [Nocardioides dokdonensis]ANH36639.1 hypothetical protein I601_0185 [Nocardioides dokdonensis FR1436]